MDGYDGQLLLGILSRVRIQVAAHGEHIAERVDKHVQECPPNQPCVHADCAVDPVPAVDELSGHAAQDPSASPALP